MTNKKVIENFKDILNLQKTTSVSKNLLSIEIEENSNLNINNFSKNQELNEIIDLNFNKYEKESQSQKENFQYKYELQKINKNEEKNLSKTNNNTYNNSKSNYNNNENNADESSEEIDVKAVLIEFVNEEKEILTKTLSGFIFYHSIQIEEVNLEYLCNLVTPIIGNFINSKKKRYKVNTFLIIFLFYFFILF
jgi:hypothetical protein